MDWRIRKASWLVEAGKEVLMYKRSIAGVGNFGARLVAWDS
jgi:hypothetical protein